MPLEEKRSGPMDTRKRIRHRAHARGRPRPPSGPGNIHYNIYKLFAVELHNGSDNERRRMI